MTDSIGIYGPTLTSIDTLIVIPGIDLQSLAHPLPLLEWAGSKTQQSLVFEIYDYHSSSTEAASSYGR